MIAQRLLFSVAVLEALFFLKVAAFGSPRFSLPDNGTGKTSASSVPAGQFPNPSSSPSDVLKAQLKALQAADMRETFRLFSRSTRLFIEDSTRRDVRESRLPQERVSSILSSMLSRDCPGLVQHGSSQILSIIGDPSPPKGRLKTRICRVKVDSSG